MSPQIIDELDASGSILFLGAGFSLGAKNIRGRDVPSGTGLRDELARILKVTSDQYTLETLVEEVHSRQNLSLYRILYRLFTVNKLNKNHIDILNLSWRRIYTTNYDDAIEFHHSQKNNNLPSYMYDDPKPRKLLNGSTIHLHGAIRSATEENILNQLILNESSYIRRHFEKSIWYDEFIRDMRFCDACFFVGYSLRDYHISALLLQNPVFQNKTYFVTRKKPDSILVNRLNPYGKILPIGVNGFADICRTASKPDFSGDLHTLKAFKYMDPLRDKKTLHPPTPIEILNLVTYGVFNYDRCLSTLPRAQYVVPRQDLADQSVKELRDVRCLLIHSYIGNGKSIFLYILAHKLSENGYRCFECRPNPIMQKKEFNFLATLGKVAIFFDSYDTAVEYVQQLAEELPNAKFIISIRTAIQDVRLHEVQARLPGPMHRISLNGMREKDANDFTELLDRSGVRVTGLEEAIRECQDFREIIVSLYNNVEIKEKVQQELTPILNDKRCRSVFIAIHLLNWVGHYVDAAFLRTVTGTDAYAEIGRFPEISRDVFRLDDDDIHVRSPMFSQYLLQRHFDTSDILDCVYSIITESVSRRAERRYQAILSSVMRFSNLERALINDPGRLDSLAILFDKLHRDIEVNREPLFWLQYSILMTACRNLEAAERFIRSAYSRAENRPHFRTFQIDTYALRLFLLIETQSNGASTIARFDEIIDKFEKVRSMLWEESRRYHAIRVLGDIEPFVNERITEMASSEKAALVQHLGLAIRDLEQLPVDVQLETGSDAIRNSINRAREKLIRS